MLYNISFQHAWPSKALYQKILIFFCHPVGLGLIIYVGFGMSKTCMNHNYCLVQNRWKKLWEPFFLFQPLLTDWCVIMTARLRIESFMGGLPLRTLIQISVHTWSMLFRTLMRSTSWSPAKRLTDSNIGHLIASKPG